MKYAIIGSGQIGTALARTFARKNIEVAIANSRGPKTLACLTKKLGPSVHPQSIHDAYEAEMIFLAVPFPAHKDVAKQFKNWNGKIGWGSCELMETTADWKSRPEFTDQLATTGNNGTVTYTKTGGSASVTVSTSGAIATTEMAFEEGLAR